ncbi:MAG: hypothetical protein H0W08_05375 [Acidobacteria bacterium]|nr:hypothetical protein [Acidobacteriota bacterium]
MTNSSALISAGSRTALRTLLLLGSLAAAGSCGSSPTQPPPVQIPQLTVTCTAPIEAQSSLGSPVPVTFGSPTTAGGQAPVTLSCTPPSGSVFNPGTTTISCSATDSRGVTATCSTSVFVRLPPRLVGSGRFLAFGDSITAGTPGTPATMMSVVVSPFAYPLQLELLLRTRYRLQAPTVLAEGIPGEQVQDGGIRRFRPLIQQMRPDVVILMEGTNDVLNFSVGVDRAAADLRTMVQQAKQENVRVLLSTIIPQRAGGLRQRDPYVFSITVLNDRIRAIATSENVPLVDMYAVFAQDLSLIGIDDVHPTARGFQVMADTFFEAIKMHFEVPQPAAGLIR